MQGVALANARLAALGLADHSLALAELVRELALREPSPRPESFPERAVSLVFAVRRDGGDSRRALLRGEQQGVLPRFRGHLYTRVAWLGVVALTGTAVRGRVVSLVLRLSTRRRHRRAGPSRGKCCSRR